MQREALVLGAGVVGLTTAHVLAERGWRVRVAAREPATRTVSAVASAFWFPFRASHPHAETWARASEARFRALYAEPASGIHPIPVRVLQRRSAPAPRWAPALPGFRALREDERPPGFPSGWAAEIPCIETPIYLEWLRADATRKGVAFDTRTIRDVADVAGEAPLVVNATGLGAREVANDASMFPIRGQIVRLAPGGLDEVILDDDADPERPTYLSPRQDGLLIGGTTVVGDWDEKPREETTRDILARCAPFFPDLSTRPILDVLVGLRPGRSTVRLEAARVGETRVIHNYGHGGSGFTFSWGCADEVARLAESA